MSLVPLEKILREAEVRNYAVGYFESWNLESLEGMWEAAEETRSPVILGFSGEQLPDSKRVVPGKLEPYAAMGLSFCKLASVPTALIFNESPYLGWIKKAIDLGFNVVMFSDEKCSYEEQKRKTVETVAMAHKKNVAVEGEMRSLHNKTWRRTSSLALASSTLTDPIQAEEFVRETGIDALAIAIGNIHITGSRKVDLDLDRLDAIKERVSIPLVLHAGSGISDETVKHAIKHGVRKINVGSSLRKVFFDALKEKISVTDPSAHPYDIIGSGLDKDVLLTGKIAVKNFVKEKMLIFGSAGKLKHLLK